MVTFPQVLPSFMLEEITFGAAQRVKLVQRIMTALAKCVCWRLFECARACACQNLVHGLRPTRQRARLPRLVAGSHAHCVRQPYSASATSAPSRIVPMRAQAFPCTFPCLLRRFCDKL